MFRRYKTLKRPSKASQLKAKIDNAIATAEMRSEQDLENIHLSHDLDENIKNLRRVFEGCSDVALREFVIGAEQIKCLAVYVNGISKKDEINENFLTPLMLDSKSVLLHEALQMQPFASYLKRTSITISEIEEIDSFKEAVNIILRGYCALYVDGIRSVLLVDTKFTPARAITESKIEPAVKGPFEAFTESSAVNTSLLRKRMKSVDFKMEKFSIGRISKTEVVVAYLKNIAEEGAVNEVKARLNKIDIDMIIDSGYIEQLIEDDPFSPFPQIQVSERPDVCAAALADGRIVILSDGSPFALIVPAIFYHFISSQEDFYIRSNFASFARALRYLALLIALFAPSIYIALTTYHQEMIPTSLLISISTSRSTVPFPALVEAFLMEITFEILREAAVRLPLPVGQAVTIVGALVIGETAVQAGIVSHEMIIVVAITGIASFAIPQFAFARGVRLLRFPLMLLAGFLGMFGIILGALLLLTHLCALRSLGVPFLSPLAPLSLDDWRDTYIREPLWRITKRPGFIQKKNPHRMRADSKPAPPAQE